MHLNPKDFESPPIAGLGAGVKQGKWDAVVEHWNRFLA